MPERVNRRDLLIETAARLFLENGYAETSVRQIAETAQVTEAALYYHFKDGKRELFQHAMEQIAPDFARVVRECDRTQSLREFVLQYGLSMMPNMAVSGVLMRWLAIQMQNPNEEAAAVVLDRLQNFHEQLAASMQRFIPNQTKAQHVTWTLIVTAAGYGYVFGAVRMSERSTFGPQDLLDVVMHIVEKYE